MWDAVNTETNVFRTKSVNYNANKYYNFALVPNSAVIIKEAIWYTGLFITCWGYSPQWPGQPHQWLGTPIKKGPEWCSGYNNFFPSCCVWSQYIGHTVKEASHGETLVGKKLYVKFFVIKRTEKKYSTKKAYNSQAARRSTSHTVSLAMVAREGGGCDAPSLRPCTA